jgi:hypothetical protein
MMKTQQGREMLIGCCGDLWIVKTNGVYMWSVNSFTSLNPVYNHSYETNTHFLRAK